MVSGGVCSRQLPWQRLTDYLLRSDSPSTQTEVIKERVMTGDKPEVRLCVRDLCATTCPHGGASASAHAQDQIPYDCSADAAAPRFIDHSTTPHWSLQELAALPYTVEQLLMLLTEGAFLRPRDPAVLYCLAMLTDLVHSDPHADVEVHAAARSAAAAAAEVEHVYGRPPADLHARYPRCCVRRFLSHAVAAWAQAGRSSAVNCYFAAGAVDRHLAATVAAEAAEAAAEAGAAAAIEAEAGGVAVACACPGLVDDVFSMQRYRRSLPTRGVVPVPSPAPHHPSTEPRRGAHGSYGAARRLFDLRLLGLVGSEMEVAERSQLLAQAALAPLYHPTRRSSPSATVSNGGGTVSGVAPPGDVFTLGPYAAWSPLVKLQVTCTDTIIEGLLKSLTHTSYCGVGRSAAAANTAPGSGTWLCYPPLNPASLTPLTNRHPPATR